MAANCLKAKKVNASPNLKVERARILIKRHLDLFLGSPETLISLSIPIHLIFMSPRLHKNLAFLKLKINSKLTQKMELILRGTSLQSPSDVKMIFRASLDRV